MNYHVSMKVRSELRCEDGTKLELPDGVVGVMYAWETQDLAKEDSDGHGVMMFGLVDPSEVKP